MKVKSRPQLHNGFTFGVLSKLEYACSELIRILTQFVSTQTKSEGADFYSLYDYRMVINVLNGRKYIYLTFCPPDKRHHQGRPREHLRRRSPNRAYKARVQSSYGGKQKRKDQLSSCKWSYLVKSAESSRSIELCINLSKFKRNAAMAGASNASTVFRP
ncbi:hypothetical protein GWI33_012208 [Rhynchophorus ferrugineus]|uniref:Uncharacterized protein n=1 Tax=Rhynchophorus ferrugineus TaxID=354439 RepID=A0A834I5V0_RHYFE|nr:hypothetical protein GWI33_012208 [Rhynchophorus ferrugineus]